MSIPRKSLGEFFWARVIEGPKCWGWSGRKDGGGYGVIQLGAGEPRIGAHRASWLLHIGPIPDGMNVLHDCDNPGCPRPDHLFLGTQGDNVRDAQMKGRMKSDGYGWHREITHCPSGHRYNEPNTYRWGTQRVCRQCRARHERNRRAKAREAVHAS